MKNFISLLLILTYILFLSCSKNESKDLVDASIIGYDLTLTPCSGGLIIKTTGQPGFYQWDFADNKFGIDEPLLFPITIKMKYHKIETCSISEGWIEVEEMEVFE